MQNQFSILTALLLCSISNAVATEWTSIIKHNDYEVFVDIDSYNIEESTPYITSKTIYKAPQTYLLNQKKVQYSASVESLQFNCIDPLFKIRSIELYDQNNKLLLLEKEVSVFKEIKSNTQVFSIGQLTCQVHQMLGGAN